MCVDTGHLHVLYIVKYAIAISFIRRQNGTFLGRDRVCASVHFVTLRRKMYIRQQFDQEEFSS